MDERFDRRELLLHLGDILDALARLAKLNSPGVPVAQLAQKEDSLREFKLLLAVAPEMTAADFSVRVADAFRLWPKALLEAELDRDALALAVQHHLFGGNPDGWTAYVADIQKKVQWFGVGLPDETRHAKTDAVRDETLAARPATSAVPPAKAVLRNEKKGWPWPAEPKSK